MVRVRSWWPDMTEAAAWVVRAIVVSSLRIEADAARKPLGAAAAPAHRPNGPSADARRSVVTRIAVCVVAVLMADRTPCW